MSSYPGKSHINRAMEDIVVDCILPFLDLSVLDADESAQERILPWACERVLWDTANGKAFFEGFPYWYKVDEQEANALISKRLREYLEKAAVGLLDYIRDFTASFEADHGVPAARLTLAEAYRRVIFMAGLLPLLKSKGLQLTTTPYTSGSTMYSSPETGRYRPLDEDKLAALIKG